DMVQSPFVDHSGSETVQLLEELPEGELIRLKLVGPDFDNPDQNTQTNIEIKLGPKEGTGEDRLLAAGIDAMEEDGRILFNGFAWNFPDKDLKARLDREFDTFAENPVVIEEVITRAQRMPKELFYIPGLLLLGLVVWLQRGRARKLKPAAA
ncbi:MAG TPA: DUF3394 domain-containing protein, partial [Devosia sp.]|nr:DUF3394 domain-containing protein [Devosia sp.]